MEEDKTKEDYKNNYEILGKLGKGGCGEVFKAKEKKTNELRAIKIIDIDNEKDKAEKGIKMVINELNNMKKCSINNEFSVKFFEYFQTKAEFIIVMELCDDNLDKYIEIKKKKFSSEEILKIMTQLNKTFKIMVKESIVHRDIKLQNILIKYLDEKKEDFIVKLTDYGISKEITNSICRSHVGTITTMAPEILEGRDYYDNKCDLWSIGIIIYKLFFNEYPYKINGEVALLRYIKKVGQKVLKKAENENLDDLIKGLIEYDLDKRFSWEEYFNHPYFLETNRTKEDYKKYYTIKEKIGKGSFGEVYKVIDKESNELRAIKIIEFDDDNKKENAKGIINELKYMKICTNDDQNLYSVRLYEYFKNEKELAIVMELCDNNLLKDLDSRDVGFNANEIFQIMNQLNDTFKIMEKNKIVHRDINLKNILVKYTDQQKTNFISKLTDYGISKQAKKSTILKTCAGTKSTMAPEIIEGNENYDIGFFIFLISAE